MVGEVIAGRYEVEELVGTGGMSSVYKAHDRLLERPVALKVLHPSSAADPETIERFRREARAVAQLSHPNIVTVIDRGEDDGRQFIVFEFVDGDNLKVLAEHDGPLPPAEALELVIPIAQALAYAHVRGIVHRDVKPQNVLVNGGGTPKVTDFGIARSLDVDGVTQTGTVLGTSSYIAPEQASGGDVGPETDVYSLGVVLYELLAGEPPFDGENFVVVAMRHVNDPIPSLAERRPDLPSPVVAAVHRALEKDPRDRFRSMDAFASELESCLLDVRGGAAEGERTLIVPPAPSGTRTPVTEVVAPQAPAQRRAAPPPRRRRGGGWTVPLLALAASMALAAFVVWSLYLDGDGNGGAGAESPPAQAQEIELSGVRAFDPPPGDGREHDDRAPNATDGDVSTYWTTETYQDFSATKEGVGLVLDAGEAVELAEITVRSETPGFTAEIRVGDSAEGPFAERVSESQTVGDSTTFAVEGSSRYWVLWITDLAGRARVNVITARG